MKNTSCLSFITVKFDFQVANMERCKWHTNKASKLSVYFNCALLIYFNAVLLATVEHSSSSRKFKNTCIILCKVMWGQFTRSVTVPVKLTIGTMLNFDGDFHGGGNATCRDQRFVFLSMKHNPRTRYTMECASRCIYS